MAWTKVQLQDHLSDSGQDVTARFATLVYIAVSDTATTAVAAETADDGVVRIPVLGAAPIAADTARKVRRVKADPDSDSPRKVFTVRVDCATAAGAGTISGNPLDADDRIVWDFTLGSEPYFKDRTTPTAKVVANSAGEPLDPFLERDTGSINATVRRYILPNAYSPAVALDYLNAVNSDAITIDGVAIDIGQAKMRSYTVGDITEVNGVSVREATFFLEFRETWDHLIEDRGYHEKHPVSQKFKEIKKGTPPTKPDKPWPLNGSGAANASQFTAPAVLTFVPYNKLPFAGFAFT